MKIISLNGSNWKSRDDFYDAFFKAVGSPGWHGRNFNALRDSITGGGINQVELPYSIHVHGLENVPFEVREFVQDFCDLVKELHSQGYAVEATCAEGN